MASANHEEALEFFSIKVADGPLTSKLQKIREGDTILVGRKATGTLIADNLIPGKRLLLLSTGTGLAPFASLIKDPDVYERFESIVLVHGCRQVSELAYGEELVAKLRDDELFGPLLTEKLSYYPTVTREPFRNRGRITDLITSEQLFNDIGQPPLDIETDRIMMCGSPAMLEELRRCSRRAAFSKAATASPAISSSRRRSSSASCRRFQHRRSAPLGRSTDLQSRMRELKPKRSLAQMSRRIHVGIAQVRLARMAWTARP